MNQNKLCKKCESLIGKGRHHQPHDRLKHESYKRISSAMGSADEDYYICLDCGQKWMHETGSCGYGWMQSN